jgi:hypothetical protein
LESPQLLLRRQRVVRRCDWIINPSYHVSYRPKHRGWREEWQPRSQPSSKSEVRSNYDVQRVRRGRRHRRQYYGKRGELPYYYRSIRTTELCASCEQWIPLDVASGVGSVAIEKRHCRLTAQHPQGGPVCCPIGGDEGLKRDGAPFSNKCET